MAYQVIIPKPVERKLEKLPDTVHSLIVGKIITLKETPRPMGCIKLKGYDNEYRIRVGDYRVRYMIDDSQSIVVILHCMHRRDIYRR